MDSMAQNPSTPRPNCASRPSSGENNSDEQVCSGVHWGQLGSVIRNTWILDETLVSQLGSLTTLCLPDGTPEGAALFSFRSPFFARGGRSPGEVPKTRDVLAVISGGEIWGGHLAVDSDGHLVTAVVDHRSNTLAVRRPTDSDLQTETPRMDSRWRLA